MVKGFASTLIKCDIVPIIKFVWFNFWHVFWRRDHFIKKDTISCLTVVNARIKNWWTDALKWCRPLKRVNNNGNKVISYLSMLYFIFLGLLLPLYLKRKTFHIIVEARNNQVILAYVQWTYWILACSQDSLTLILGPKKYIPINATTHNICIVDYI